jgi:hypothetical protein
VHPLIGYTVTGLMLSSDAIANPVAGRLYEATLKVDAQAGWATPVVPNFNARAERCHPAARRAAPVCGPTSHSKSLSSTGRPPGRRFPTLTYGFHCDPAAAEQLSFPGRDRTVQGRGDN